MKSVNIIGGGLAGCEAAWQLSKRGIAVTIFELRDENRKSFAHKTDVLAELVCSNSFRNDDIKSGIGLLHAEMRALDSLILRAADENKVPAGSALAVDRDGFAQFVQNEIQKNPLIKIVRKEISELPQDDGNLWIVATGPLTSDALSKSILANTGEEHLAFFDAIAPIVFKESIDFSKAWFQSRYDKVGPGGDGKDYINCPLTKDQYFEFVDDLNAGEKTEFKDWEKNSLRQTAGAPPCGDPHVDHNLNNNSKSDQHSLRQIAGAPPCGDPHVDHNLNNNSKSDQHTPYFEGCLPIEVMAERGVETLRFGPLKPVGLTNPHDPTVKSYAIVQLRQDNKIGTLYNMVGFQTKLKYADQLRVFKKIPGLENAEFARMGGIHRNTFINSPKLLDEKLRFKKMPHIRFAGQVTGVEGYVESASMGLLCGIFAAAEIMEKEISLPKITTAIGSLLNHITIGHLSDEEPKNFQPMNVNFGLFEKLTGKIKKDQRKEAYVSRAVADLEEWKKDVLS